MLTMNIARNWAARFIMFCATESHGLKFRGERESGEGVKILAQCLRRGYDP